MGTKARFTASPVRWVVAPAGHQMWALYGGIREDGRSSAAGPKNHGAEEASVADPGHS